MLFQKKSELAATSVFLRVVLAATSVFLGVVLMLQADYQCYDVGVFFGVER